MRDLTIGDVGWHSIGNPSVTDINVIDSIDDKIANIKTLVGGEWKTWSKTAPAEYNDFSIIEAGKGYVVENTASTTLMLPEVNENFTNININIGLNLLAPTLAGGDVRDNSRWTSTFTKTIINGSWKSWNVNSPDEYQDFTEFENFKGYVVNVDSIKDDVSSDIPTSISLGIAGSLFEESVNENINILKFIFSTRRF